MDVLGDILATLRLTGGVILEGTAAGDWCVSSQLQAQDIAALFPNSGPIIAYHYVKSGRLFAQVGDQPAQVVEDGSIVMFPRNDRHRLFTSSSKTPIDSHEYLIGATENGLARFTIEGEGKPVEFYCGFLGVEAGDHPLLDCLPEMMKIDDISQAQEDWLESNLTYLTADRPRHDVLARIAESLFAEAIRAYVDDLPEGEGGWLAGLRDPAVARALAVIHARFADDLDIETLAREAGVSRTVLGERFTTLLGEPPMRYCARWRMRQAAAMLRLGKDSTANIAYAVGFNSEAAFNRAFKREHGEPPATWKRHVIEASGASRNEAAELPPQEIRYTRARDNTRLAYSIVGDGRPLVKTANWLNHIAHDWKSPIWRHWVRELTRGHCLIRYDERANGLSDWDTPEISFDAFVDDLESVVDCAELDHFDLLGISQGAAVAIAYAVRHPEKVRRIILCGGYAAGWEARGEAGEIERREAMLTLTQVGWGSDNPAYRQLFTSLYVPGATAEEADWFNDLQRLTASPANAVRMMRVFGAIDVRDILSQVKAPTIVFHARGDMAVPFACGEELAERIPDARFVPLDSDNHILLGNEAAFSRFIVESRHFLADGGL